MAAGAGRAPDAGLRRQLRRRTVEPVGTFEDDPNLTNKRFPGNPTRSYRTAQALRIVAEVEDWTGHSPESIAQMLDHLAALRREGRAVIED